MQYSCLVIILFCAGLYKSALFLPFLLVKLRFRHSVFLVFRASISFVFSYSALCFVMSSQKSRYGFLIVFFKNEPFINEGEFLKLSEGKLRFPKEQVLS